MRLGLIWCFWSATMRMAELPAILYRREIISGMLRQRERNQGAKLGRFGEAQLILAPALPHLAPGFGARVFSLENRVLSGTSLVGSNN